VLGNVYGLKLPNADCSLSLIFYYVILNNFGTFSFPIDDCETFTQYLLTLLIIYLLNFTYSLLEQMDTFPYLGPLITEDGECTTEFRTRLNKGQAIAAENMEKSRHIDFKEDTTDESASVACSNILL